MVHVCLYENISNHDNNTLNRFLQSLIYISNDNCKAINFKRVNSWLINMSPNLVRMGYKTYVLQVGKVFFMQITSG